MVEVISPKILNNSEIQHCSNLSLWRFHWKELSFTVTLYLLTKLINNPPPPPPKKKKEKKQVTMVIMYYEGHSLLIPCSLSNWSLIC